ncbi:MAG: hypothetical protein JRN11_07150 [Nitrososphaerota archaeon]|nr:hypothetical protein [Nitrososphaerota archaeon]
MAFLIQFNISVLEVSKTVGIPYRNAFYIAKKTRGGMYVNLQCPGMVCEGFEPTYVDSHPTQGRHYRQQHD